jgi:hypothetical protein
MSRTDCGQARIIQVLRHSGRDRHAIHCRADRLVARDQLAEAECVPHLVCARKQARDAEPLAFGQARESRVLGTGGCST